MTGTVATGVIVRMRHVRAAGLCAAGVRGWFRGRDRALMQRFCREGLPLEQVEAFGDALSLQVAAAARAEALRDARLPEAEVAHGR